MKLVPTVKSISLLVLFAMFAHSLSAQEVKNPPCLLEKYPPTLDKSRRDPETLTEYPSPTSKLKAFRNITYKHQTIIGVVDEDQKILWQKSTGSRAIFKIFWSGDSDYVLFYTDYVYRNVDLYAKNAYDEETGETGSRNYIYIINAKTGDIIHEFDPDIEILHLEKIPDPRKLGPTLLGGGGIIDNIEMDGNKLTVTENIFSPHFRLAPGTPPLPEWFKKPFIGSIEIPGIPAPKK